jgi:hypothetical protein
MRRRLSALLLPLGAVALVGFTTACGDDGNGNGTNPPPETDLSGTYQLVSITQSGLTLSPPLATGSMTLSQTSYEVDLIVANQSGGQDMIHDEGTYSTSGNSWTQESTILPVQSVGTFSLQGSTLTVDVTSPEPVTTVWNKTL